MTANANDEIFHRAVLKLLAEIVDGAPSDESYVLNPGDMGLLRQLDTIDAAAASSRPMPGQTTIASHIDHVLYGFTLLNRWASGEANPWADADWKVSWTRSVVDEARWTTLRTELRDHAGRWRKSLQARAAWNDISAAGAIASVVHTAYHLGAVRQILAAQRAT
jgi:hypothetical protein